LGQKDVTGIQGLLESTPKPFSDVRPLLLAAALFVLSLHRLRLWFHHVMWLRHRVMVMVMIVVVMDDHAVRHVRLSRFLHGHFLTLSEGRDNEAERSDSR
jgi:hypothetical protein